MPRHLAENEDPIALFHAWFAQAKASEPNDPEAMTLATADADGVPDARMVLMKGFDARGFVFYTNAQSAKGEQIASNARGAILFHWKSLRRQVRARGVLEVVDAATSDAYFASRPRDSRIGAWASRQSRPLEGPMALEKAVAAAAARYGLGEVPRPPHWQGYRLRPLQYEFWRDRPFRLHERLQFARDDVDSALWTERRLYP